MKKIIFLGAGYANLSLIKSLSKEDLTKAEFLLINNNSYHYKTTELHKIAANESEKNIKIPLKDIIPSEIVIIQDSAIKIEGNKLYCKNTDYDFDEIYVGLGANKNTFGIEGLDEAYEIGTYEDALKTKEIIYSNLEKSESIYKNIVICGAGFSGVELCASIAQVCKSKGIDAKISIVEAMDEILPMYNKDLAKVARNYLEKLGVKVLTSHKIIKKVGDRLYLNNEDTYIDSKNIIFTAGVKGNEVIKNSVFENKNNRILVNEFLQAPNYSNCYILGDCSLIMNNDRPFAPTAQIACKQGNYLARSLSARLNNEEFKETFIYKDQGSVCSLSEKYAVASIQGKDFSGFLAKVLKKITELKWQYKLFGFKGL
ncbi:NAD(P)/FAD-dependent oxidoreductase [Campylobacter sp. RM12640]|uniref:NAD(P)/FAD-dependent oxidoreductase n=1 Tax=unclassified Campylobacter TaxID=2593542 RepID=UPI0030153EBA|nr:NAD(P)/FAD-dependent oxidoreductase [Campylobacter sp. RM12640]MBZ7989363.1 NAD(P)/FAD-dependent oxidoreductase [Campylobacter sp. RM12635]